jgi:hypothetical protein
MNAKSEAKICTFLTLMGEQEIDMKIPQPTLELVNQNLDKAVIWLAQMQNNDGGFSSAARCQPNDRSDAATTAIAAMAFLRHGKNDPNYKYADKLKSAKDYLMKSVMATPPDGSNIMNQSRGQTQIQRKLGRNIDLILATQFLSNLLQSTDKDDSEYEDIFNHVNRAIDGMQQMQTKNGSFKSAGWAGVLQSALANNALEVATHKGAWVEESILDKSRNYHKSNFNPTTSSVRTNDGAGVMLYAVASTIRATAKESRKAKEIIQHGITKGILGLNAKVTVDNLKICGLKDNESLKLYTAHNIYTAAKIKSQETKVQNGFGNNGGEEFLSHLQAGESFVLAKESDWKEWYENMSTQLNSAQKQDGYWEGHHCITSPVFCTATNILILSIQNDVDQLMALGE